MNVDQKQQSYCKTAKVVILVFALVGALLMPLLGLWIPKIRDTYDFFAFGIIALSVIYLLRQKAMTIITMQTVSLSIMWG